MVENKYFPLNLEKPPGISDEVFDKLRGWLEFGTDNGAEKFIEDNIKLSILADQTGMNVPCFPKPNIEQAKAIAVVALQFVPRGGRFGKLLHSTLRNLLTNFAFEAVLLRRNSTTGKLQVFTSLRPEGKGEAYPNLWHCPGTNADSTDFVGDLGVINRMFERVNCKEFGGVLVGYTFVGDCYGNSEYDAGIESKVFLVEASQDPPAEKGQWWDVDALPENTVEIHQRSIIPMAAEMFLKFESMEGEG